MEMNSRGLCWVGVAFCSILLLGSGPAYGYNDSQPLFDCAFNPWYHDYYECREPARDEWDCGHYAPGIDEHGHDASYNVNPSVQPDIYYEYGPGTAMYWDDPRAIAAYTWMKATGHPVTIYNPPPPTAAAASPFGNPSALFDTIHTYLGPNGTGLDFLILDYEWENVPYLDSVEDVRNAVATAVSIVRTSGYASVSNAEIGNYDFFPCTDALYQENPSWQTASWVQRINDARPT